MKALASIIFSFLLFVAITNAQGLPAASNTNVTFKISNENPQPGQQITITAQSFSVNLDASTNTWTLNGSVYQKGIGVKAIEVKAPELGKKMAIHFSAITSEGKEVKADLSIGSGSIDMIIENGGYIPPFFSGKMPLSYQNVYRVSAFPHLANSSGKEYDPKTLIYQWTKDTKAVSDQSGYGKQTFSWQDDMVPSQRTIKVRVSSRDGAAQAQTSIYLKAQSPAITFYNNDPLYGPMYNKAIGEKISIGNSRELSVLAVPYGFNMSSVAKFAFTWLVNSIEQSDLSTSQSIVLRAPQNTGGSSEIRLQIRNNNQILQGATNGFTASFSSKDIGADNTNGTINNYNGI